MRRVPRTLWNVAHPQLSGTELFDLDERGSDVVLNGWVVAAVDGTACAASYEVVADPGWVTRRVLIILASDSDRTLTIDHDGEGGWSVDGVPRPDLFSCRDVDLGISPSTNTLPIRRLRTGVGDVVHLDAAWVRFPQMTVEVLSQTYERIGDSSYRYSSTNFQRNLEVDDDGVVVRYGDDLWQAVDLGR